MAIHIELSIEQLASILKRLGPKELAELESLIDQPESDTQEPVAVMAQAT